MKWFEMSFGRTLEGGWAVNPQEEGTGVAENECNGRTCSCIHTERASARSGRKPRDGNIIPNVNAGLAAPFKGGGH